MKNDYYEQAQESTDDEDNSGSTNVSKTHIYLADTADPDERGVALNHNTEARELTKSSGDLYRAFTKRGDSRQAWSISDTLSHIVGDFKRLTDHLPDAPSVWVNFMEELIDAAEDSFNGDNLTALRMFEPTPKEVAVYVETHSSDGDDEEHTIEDLENAIEAVKDARDDDE